MIKILALDGAAVVAPLTINSVVKSVTIPGNTIGPDDVLIADIFVGPNPAAKRVDIVVGGYSQKGFPNKLPFPSVITAGGSFWLRVFFCNLHSTQSQLIAVTSNVSAVDTLGTVSAPAGKFPDNYFDIPAAALPLIGTIDTTQSVVFAVSTGNPNADFTLLGWFVRVVKGVGAD